MTEKVDDYLKDAINHLDTTDDFDDENHVSDPLEKHTIIVYGHQFDFKLNKVDPKHYHEVFEHIKDGINHLHFSKAYNLHQRGELGKFYQFAFLNGKSNQAAKIINDDALTLTDKKLALIKLLDPDSYNEFVKTHKTLINQLRLMN